MTAIRTPKTSETVMDELLVLRAQEGDMRALSLLAGRWNDRFLAHAWRLTGDRDAGRDVVQEAWLAIVRRLPTLGDVSRFRAWAYRIVGNKSRDWIRGRRRRRAGVERLSREPIDAVTDPEAAQSQEPGGEPETGRLRAELRRLDAEHRVVLSLFYLEGLKVREIADALELPRGTVKSRLFYAREQLRRALFDQGGDR
ncbi:MAG TPA: RNA polymerase sigma factor [Thermoanaerobaculia bacterium]|nr:RNA polymerase sigma factor [Thermoanaerobaculia bacterium]